MRDVLQTQDPDKGTVISPKSAAVYGILLAMPFTVLLVIEVNGIVPLSSFLREVTIKRDGNGLNAFGTVLILGSILLLPTAFVINIIPITRNLRAGIRISTNPINYLLAIVFFVYISIAFVLFIVDRYPCWIGVPNCD